MDSRDYFLLKAMTGWQSVELSDIPTPAAPEGALESLDEVLLHLEGINTVTLDIFDTLLCRDVEPSDYPKRATMQQLSLLLAQIGISLSIEELLTLRDEAEALARQAALALGGDAECTLSEVFAQLYQLINTRFGVELEPLLPQQQLVEFEVQVEIERLSPLPGAQRLLQALKQRDIKIFLLSDMYLETQHIQDILRHHKLYENIDALYVSSDSRRSKGTGNLFAHLVAAGELVPEQTLHVGDHPIADFQRPRQHGLHARLLHSHEEKQRRAILDQALRLARRYGDSSHLWQLSSTSQPTAPSPYQIGYQRLGPLFTLFAMDVLFKALRGTYREVFFLARDAYLLQQLYSQLRKKLHLTRLLGTPAGRYLYLSRASSRIAALTGQHDDLLSLAQRVNRQDGMWALIAALGLDRDRYESLITELMPTIETQDSLEQSADQLHRLLNTPRFAAQLMVDMAESTQRLHDYLVQEKFLAEGNILLVDIGWNGSILANLEKAFGDSPIFPHIDASFFGRRYGERLEKIHLEPGFAYDSHRPNPLEHLINECRELFETAASSMEGSVLGYVSTPNGIAPHCAESTLSSSDKSLIAEIQQGILAYCDDFAHMYNRFALPLEALHYDAVLQATSLIAGTHPAEQEVIADLKFDLSWGTEGRVSMREYLGTNMSTALAPPPHARTSLQISVSGESGTTRDMQKVFENIHQMVERLRQEERLIIYGVGTIASLIAPLLLDKIAYFIDGNSTLHGQRFLGRLIRPPEVLLDERNHSVFITPINRKSVISQRLAGCSLPLYFIDDFL